MELKPAERMKRMDAFILLIVPYGIETNSSENSQAIPRTFNRTLWN